MAKRVPTSILVSILLLSLMTASCNTPAPTTPTTDAPIETNVITEAEPESLRGDRLTSSLPDGLDLQNDSVRIWYYQNENPANSISIAGDDSGDIVDAALYKTNRTIEDSLNVTLDFYLSDASRGDTGDTIRKLAMAADDVYDIYYVCQWNATMLAAEHFFLDLSDAPYINIDNPWWSKNYIDACSIGEKHRYFFAGDISLNMIRCISSLYFNKSMLENLGHNVVNLYQTALDGQWTLDQMLTLSNDAYSDLNGNGITDDGDQVGTLFTFLNALDSISFGLGLQLTTHDENHYPVLTGENEHNADVFLKMNTLVNESKSILCITGDPDFVMQYFREGHSLFMGGFLYHAEILRDMEDDFGILPYPKYDENQEDYRSVLHDIATLVCVPVTCSKFETTSAVLEALSYNNYYDVTPVYYESALKVKYARDEITPKVIDIIHESAMTDISYVYIDAFNNLGRIMRETDKLKNYASTYKKISKSAQKAMEKFIEAFEDEST